jgi:hypothetical protein
MTFLEIWGWSVVATHLLGFELLEAGWRRAGRWPAKGTFLVAIEPRVISYVFGKLPRPSNLCLVLGRSLLVAHYVLLFGGIALAVIGRYVRW